MQRAHGLAPLSQKYRYLINYYRIREQHVRLISLLQSVVAVKLSIWLSSFVLAPVQYRTRQFEIITSLMFNPCQYSAYGNCWKWLHHRQVPRRRAWVVICLHNPRYWTTCITWCADNSSCHGKKIWRIVSNCLPLSIFSQIFSVITMFQFISSNNMANK